MISALSIITLGFLIGMRHAVDADHLIAVSTIVSRHRGARQAALTGMLWGLGHTLTIVLVGAGIILFNLVVPRRIGLGMELAVGVVLILLGLANIVRSVRRGAATVHPHPSEPGARALIDSTDSTDSARRRFGLFEGARPMVVGVVHGLAGSSAVALLVLAAIPDPRWATAYLVVFGLGTIAGMVLATVTMASAMRLTESRSVRFSGGVGLASGVLSLGFGFFIAYQIYVAAFA